MVDSGTYTPETIARRIEMAKALLADPKRPITHWAEGLNEVAKGALGGYQMSRAENAERQGQDELAQSYRQRLGYPDAPSAPPQPQSPAEITAAPLAPIAAPAPDAGAAPVPAGPVPRGIRNNNPLNIEAGGFTKGQPGFVGSDGRFAKFDTPEAGIGAANTLLDTYQRKYGLNTPAGIVGRWAPAGDGNNVSAYAMDIAKTLGIGPNDPIPPEMRPQLIAAMGKHENGRGIGDVAAALVKPPQAAGTGQPAPYQVAGPPVATSGQNAPVSQNGPAPASPAAAPSVQPQSDAKRQIADMLNSKNPYIRRQGMALANKVFENEAVQKPTDEMREYDLYRRQGGKDSFFDYKAGLKKAGAQNVSVNNTINPILKGVGDRFNETMDTARAAVPQIQGIFEARKALDQGAITGLGADPKLFLSKAANLFGLGGEAASNTEVARSAIGNSVLAKAKSLGANPSNADRDYIEKVVGGSIALEEKSIRRLLDMQERWARDAIKRANADGQKLLTAQPEELKGIGGLLQVQEPDTYENFLKTNPIAAPAAAAASPGNAAPKIRKFNPATGTIE